ncbi:MAG: 6-carboxytetrahydropterin synthase QueD [Theionarchaea archaeon]|nr:6-carboxytetrahydropterin synthase QueD [Theionarchaea archaeon]
MRLSREFKFDAAHNLVGYDGICAQIHGHTYTLTVTVEGEPDNTGMLMDFFHMKKIVEETVLSRVDHTYLNDLYDQPTVENVAKDMFERLDEAFKKTTVALYSVKVYEGPKCCVEVFA